MSEKARIELQESGRASGDQLRDYEQLKFELAALVRSAVAGLSRPRDPEVEREYQSLLSRLAEDHFNLAVIGQFNRGKTSLMNAVLGLDRLPTGIVPLTSVITVVRYGSRESVQVQYENGLPREITLDEIRAYVTEEGNPGNEKHIRSAEVQLPAEILRRGFRFVDTPGLGSGIAANTATTRQYLPEADALVFVTSFEAPLTELELDYLRLSRDLVRRTFVVVNKADLVSHDEKSRALEFIRKRLSENGLSDARIYPTSARQGLAVRTRQANDSDLQHSGIPDFERALVEFLVKEKSRDFLVQNCGRLLRLATDNSASEELIASIANLKARIEGLEPAKAQNDALKTARAARVRQFCPVCSNASRAVWDFLTKYQYALSHDLQEQAAHAARRGFCWQHTWQYEFIASPRGVCNAYPGVLSKVAEDIQQGRSGDGANAEEASSRDSNGVHCLCCEVRAKAESEALQRIAGSLQEFKGVLCLPHLRRLVHSTGPSSAEQLVVRCAAVLTRIAEDMQRFSLRMDGLKRVLISKEDQEAYYRGLALLAGDRRLALPPHEDVEI
jgi:GTP-binding protein EngB required for normal cell division